MASELLIEIGCEEIPARFLPPALAQLAEKSKDALSCAKITHGEVSTYGTPRRICLAIHNVAQIQQGWEEKKLGPAVKSAFGADGSPTKAAEGFARSCGVSVSELSREETPKGERLAHVKKIEGRPAAEILAELIPALIRSLEFKKAMRWGSGELAFVRPIHWIVSIFGGEVIEFSLDGIKSGNVTRGHRFTHPGPVEVTSVADYLEQMDKRNVIPAPAFRREIIEKQVEQKAAEFGGELFPDHGLMEEVTNLVEFPVVLCGGFDQRFLKLPPEVLIAAMRTHQRYFAIRKTGTDKDLLPFFITVANTPARDQAVVARGNERVLSARLADAEFYWREDIAAGMEKMREGTSGMVFYKTLGSYLDKMDRVSRLCESIAAAIYPEEPGVAEVAARAASYCKADLVSQMVGEFPELQGVMGGEYALAGGFDAETASAISDHYLPRSAEDISEGTYPCSPAGNVLAMADKLDSVVSCWAAGLAPTGSGDPFALRRQAQGVINLILAKGFRLCLPEVIAQAARTSCPLTGADPEKTASEVREFIMTRVRVQLIDAGYAYDVVDACLAVWNGDLQDTMHKIEAVARMKSREDFDDLMVAFRRLMNIVEGEPGEVLPELLKEESEALLWNRYLKAKKEIEPRLAAGSYDQALELMAGLKPAVDGFFDGVLVNVEDAGIRRNRHAICAAAARLFKKIADFSRIVIQGDRERR